MIAKPDGGSLVRGQSLVFDRYKRSVNSRANSNIKLRFRGNQYLIDILLVFENWRM